MNNKSMFLRNPIHIFMFLREEIRHIFGAYKVLVTFSDGTRSLVEKYYPRIDKRKIVLIPNGVDLEKFHPVERPVLPDESLKLIFVGHEFERKGLAIILEAMRVLPDCVSLTVVGGDDDSIKSYAALAEKLGVKNRVRFLGRRTDVPALLGDSDVFIMPSSNEGWSLAFIEAMATGTPVISTPVGSALTLIENGVNGFIVSRDSDSIVETVTRILDNRGDLQLVREASIRTAVEYSWDNIARKYIKLAGEIRSNRKRF